MLDSTQRTTAAELLWAAERDLAPIGPLTETFPGIDVVDAYEIQLANIRRKITAGARVRGHKVGLSSPVMQQMMGAATPARSSATRPPASPGWPGRWPTSA
jgi:2-keto-4-pentenoate hydratase